MLYINISFLSVFIILLLVNYLYKFRLFTDEPKADNRKIHSKKLISIGGVTFITLLLVVPEIDNNFMIFFIFFSYLLLLFGLLGDTEILVNSTQRFFYLLIIISFYVLYNDLTIENFHHSLLNEFIVKYKFISILFSILGLMFLVNGFNFIDGINGLALGVSILIVINFILNIDSSNTEILKILNCFLIICIILFIFNFFIGNIIIGDGGAYFCGFFIGVMSIYLANKEIIIATKIACIIFYPFMEIFFTFWRRLINKSNPLNPDFLHLHSLVYRLVANQFKNTQNKFFTDNLNSLVSLIILFSITIVLLFTNIIMNYFGNLNTFFILCFLYLIVYIGLARKVNKESIN